MKLANLLIVLATFALPAFAFAQADGTSTGGRPLNPTDLSKIQDCGANELERGYLSEVIGNLNDGSTTNAEKYLAAYKKSAYRGNTLGFGPRRWRSEALERCYIKLSADINDAKKKAPLGNPRVPPVPNGRG